MNILSAKFLAGYPNAADMAPSDKREFAVIGRSNAGKSTLINRLTGQRRQALARVSNTPGKTTEINLFGLEATHHKNKHSFVVADLPGFGFAKLSHTERERMARATVEYIESRSNLFAVLLLIDSKRPAGEDEWSIQQAANDAGKSLIVVATKCDRLNQSEKISCLKTLATSLHLEPRDLVSAGEGMPLDPLWERILAVAPDVVL